MLVTLVAILCNSQLCLEKEARGRVRRAAGPDAATARPMGYADENKSFDPRLFIMLGR
jgi:hypothetical protein